MAGLLLYIRAAALVMLGCMPGWAFDAWISAWKPDGIEASINAWESDPIHLHSPLLLTETTASDAVALLRAIQMHPDEDTPRLAYADYLDEHGEADAAEFIRVQCRAAHFPRGQQYRQDVNRAFELARLYGAAWLAPINRRLQASAERYLGEYLGTKSFYDVYATFRRGFIWGIDIHFGPGGDEIKRSDRAFISQAFPEIVDFIVPAPLAFRIQNISGLSYTLNYLLKRPSTTPTVAVSLFPDDFRHLGQVRFRRLVREGIRDIHLEIEDGAGKMFLPAAMRDLATYPEYRELQQLRISPYEQLHAAHFDDDNVWVERFARAKWPHLIRLGLASTGLDRSSLTPLIARRANFPALQELDLTSNCLDDTALSEWGAVPWRKLLQLDLSGNPFSDDALKALRKSRLPKLQYLDVHREPGPAGTKGPVSLGERSRSGRACGILMKRTAAGYF